VPGEQRVMIRTGVERMAEYLEKTVGQEQVDARVFAVEALDSLEAASRRAAQEGVDIPFETIGRRLAFTVAEAYLDNIFINTSSPYWQALSAVQQLRVTAHEYFHVVQMHLMGRERAEAIFTTPSIHERAEGPTWLIEGAAEYVSWHFIESLNLGDADDVPGATGPDGVAALRLLETYLGYSGEEDKGPISLQAVTLLLGERDPSALVGFYRLLGAGFAWRDAFRAAFGRTIDAFYLEYQSVYG
jgi:hypothetical protein